MLNQAIHDAYSTGQVGGDLPYFVGKQYGRGWLRTLARIAFPILRRVGRVAVKTAQDVIEDNKEILPSLAKHAFKEVAGRKRPAQTPQNSRRPKRILYGNGLDNL